MKRFTLLLSYILVVLITGAALAQEDPVIFYDSFVKVSTNAKSIDEIKPYLSQKNLKEMGDISKEDEAFFLEFMQEARTTMTRKSISSKVEGDKATLTIKAVSTTDNSPVDGTVKLVKENGTWKVDNEEFMSSATIE